MEAFYDGIPEDDVCGMSDVSALYSTISPRYKKDAWLDGRGLDKWWTIGVVMNPAREEIF